MLVTNSRSGTNQFKLFSEYLPGSPVRGDTSGYNEYVNQSGKTIKSEALTFLLEQFLIKRYVTQFNKFVT